MTRRIRPLVAAFGLFIAGPPTGAGPAMAGAEVMVARAALVWLRSSAGVYLSVVVSPAVVLVLDVAGGRRRCPSPTIEAPTLLQTPR